MLPYLDKKFFADVIKDLEVTRSLCVPKWVLNAITNVLRRQRQKDNFPGAAVDGHLPANAGDIGLIPGLGGFYMPRATKPMYHNHWVCAQSVSFTGPNAGWTASHFPTPRGSKGEYTPPPPTSSFCWLCQFLACGHITPVHPPSSHHLLLHESNSPLPLSF